ncbi:hypothetical protein JRQ81_003256 [Phrynocephalus forsythii]|uniref:Uncharacterized protein n=1 Tax=Phrynocephalus forsythii TaxID=171643 RepID=A0A9Q0XJI6_9SAUR|nr:hypothetical protein JRQ81_003256 [Phrynocephalus forsythii]
MSKLSVLEALIHEHYQARHILSLFVMTLKLGETRKETVKSEGMTAEPAVIPHWEDRKETPFCLRMRWRG